MFQSLNERRILVAEDEYFIAQDISRTLRKMGADIAGPVATVAGAMEMVRCGDIDAAVLDINLRGGMVYSVAETLSEQGVPFIFATGYSIDAIPDRFSQVVRCEKPVEPATIAEAVNKLPFAGKRATYAISSEPDVWRWKVRRDGVSQAQGDSDTDVNARVAAFLAAIKLLD